MGRAKERRSRTSQSTSNPLPIQTLENRRRTAHFRRARRWKLARTFQILIPRLRPKLLASSSGFEEFPFVLSSDNIGNRDLFKSSCCTVCSAFILPGRPYFSGVALKCEFYFTKNNDIFYLELRMFHCFMISCIQHFQSLIFFMYTQNI